jgi:hypothetical protein
LGLSLLRWRFSRCGAVSAELEVLNDD